MTTYKSDPISMRITRKEINSNPVSVPGVTRIWDKNPDFPERKDMYILRMEASDIIPNRPQLEQYPEAFEKELDKFRKNILSDRVRSPKFFKLTEHDLKSIQVETVYNSKQLDNNKYDKQLGRAIKLKKFHKLPDGKFFVKIDGFKDDGYGY